MVNPKWTPGPWKSDTIHTAHVIHASENDMTPESPPCRICKSKEHVVSYPDNHSETVCPECCGNADHGDGERGHQFEFHYGEGWTCRYCGDERGPWNYDYPDED